MFQNYAEILKYLGLALLKIQFSKDLCLVFRIPNNLIDSVEISKEFGLHGPQFNTLSMS